MDNIPDFMKGVDMSGYMDNTPDQQEKETFKCFACKKVGEDICIEYGGCRFHEQCLKCATCKKLLGPGKSGVVQIAKLFYCEQHGNVKEEQAETEEDIAAEQEMQKLLQEARSKNPNALLITDISRLEKEGKAAEKIVSKQLGKS